jgi:hypothetical protein
MLALSDRDGFEPRMHAESPQQVADVVPDGFRAQMELLRDLAGGVTFLEEAQDFRLAGCQMRREVLVCVLFLDIGQLSEHADETVALHQGHGADVDADTAAVRAEKNDMRIRHLLGAGDLPREMLARSAGVLRRYDRRELPAADVADEAARCRIDPADDTRRVDDVARNADTLKCSFDVAADLAETRHLSDCAPIVAPRSSPAVHRPVPPRSAARARARLECHR